MQCAVKVTALTFGGDFELFAAQRGQDLAVSQVGLRMVALDEVVEDRLAGELVDVERIEAPVDGVPLDERVVHGHEGRVETVRLEAVGQAGALQVARELGRGRAHEAQRLHQLVVEGGAGVDVHGPLGRRRRHFQQMVRHLANRVRVPAKTFPIKIRTLNFDPRLDWNEFWLNGIQYATTALSIKTYL